DDGPTMEADGSSRVPTFLVSKPFRRSLQVAVVILVALVLINLAFFGFDDELQNTRKEVSVLEAVDAGEDGTLVIWYDQAYKAPPFQHSVLDDKGRFTYEPRDLLQGQIDYDPPNLYGDNVRPGYSRTVATDGGPITFTMERGAYGLYEVFSRSLDPTAGTYSEPVVVDRSVPVELMDFQVVASENEVHVLVLGYVNRSEEYFASNTYYVGSDDSGISWDTPVQLLPPPWQASKGMLFCYDDDVVAVVSAATDWTTGFAAPTHFMLRSSDGGATWSEPIECTDFPIPLDIVFARGTVDVDGSVFLIANYGQTERYYLRNTCMIRISPTGEVRLLDMPEPKPFIDLIGGEETAPTVPLFYEDPATGERLMFITAGTARRWYDPFQYYVMRLDGTVKEIHKVPGDDEGLAISITTRYEDGWVYGIGIEDFYAGSCDVWRVAEIHYIKTDVETGKTKLVGMPYTIKDRTSDDDRTAYEARSLGLMGLLITVSVFMALVTFLAWRRGELTDRSPEALKRARRLTKMGAVALAVYMMVYIFYLLIEGEADALPFALLGGYFIVAVLLVELPVAYLDDLEWLRGFHLMTFATGLLILLALTFDSMNIGFQLVEGLYSPMMILQWLVMLALTAFVANRAIKTARGDRQFVPRVTISAGVFIFVMFMPMLYRISIPALGG
ncbi:MAG: hypothetical protein KAQ96_05610, partial [Thermoplasmata archaeon]|nr:hypothetical protein [Thermoplasmata archaeon]